MRSVMIAVCVCGKVLRERLKAIGEHGHRTVLTDITVGMVDCRQTLD